MSTGFNVRRAQFESVDTMYFRSIRFVVLLTAALGFIACQPDSDSGEKSDFSVERRYESTFEQEPGTHLTFAYVTSQDCGPCHKPELKKAIEEAKVKLQEHASDNAQQFSDYVRNDEEAFESASSGKLGL